MRDSAGTGGRLCNGTGVAKRSYPTSKVRTAERRYPMFLVGASAKRSYPMPKLRGSSREEIPHVQGHGG